MSTLELSSRDIPVVVSVSNSPSPPDTQDNEDEELLRYDNSPVVRFDYSYQRPSREASSRANGGRKQLFTENVPRWPFLCICGYEIGRMTVCCELPGKKDSDEKRICCLIPACWPISFLWTIVIVAAPSLVFLTIARGLPLPVTIVGSMLQFATLCAFCGSAYRDPGIFPRYKEIPGLLKPTDEDKREKKETSTKRDQDTHCHNPQSSQYSLPIVEERFVGWRYCKEVNAFRPPGVNYDRESAVLVQRVDHFCPVIGTCVEDHS